MNETHSAQVKDAISNHLQAYGADIWHWISNIWLVVDKQNCLDRIQLRQDIYAIIKIGTVLVIEADNPSLCSGMASPEAGQWIKENWNNTKKFDNG